MKKFQDKNHADRMKDAAQAKQALLSKLKASMPSPDDPAVKERIAQQLAVAKARDDRAAARQAEKERLAQEDAARRAAVEAERIAAAAREAEEQAARAAALEAEQKAARDARYAARKKGKKG